MWVDEEMFVCVGVIWEQVENYVSMLCNVEGVQFVVMVKDYGDWVKFLLCLCGLVSVQNIVVVFGGGGYVFVVGVMVIFFYVEVWV